MRFITLFLILLLSTSSFAQESKPEIKKPESKVEIKEPTKKDFEDALKQYTVWSNNLNKASWYKDVTLIEMILDEKTKQKSPKEIKFLEFTEYDKDLFYLLQGRKLTGELTRLDYYWRSEKERIRKKMLLVHQGLEKWKTGDLVQEDIDKYLERLRALRIATAIKFETLIISTFKKYEKQVPKKEFEEFYDQIKEYHDRYKLINRGEK
jgi:hypothetical protein